MKLNITEKKGQIITSGYVKAAIDETKTIFPPLQTLL